MLKAAPYGIFIEARLLDMGSSWVSTYWYITWEIRYRTGVRLVDLDGDLLGVFFSFSDIYTCSGYLDSDSSRVIFLSLSIGRSIGRFWAQSGDIEFDRDLDQDIARATSGSIGRP